MQVYNNHLWLDFVKKVLTWDTIIFLNSSAQLIISWCLWQNVSPASLVKLLKERRSNWMNFNFTSHPIAFSKAACFTYPGLSTHNLSETAVFLGHTNHEDEVCSLYTMLLLFTYFQITDFWKWWTRYCWWPSCQWYFNLFLLFMFPCQTLEIIRFENLADHQQNGSSGELYHLQVKSYSSYYWLLVTLSSVFP